MVNSEELIGTTEYLTTSKVLYKPMLLQPGSTVFNPVTAIHKTHYVQHSSSAEDVIR
jgi:hypothetical protein